MTKESDGLEDYEQLKKLSIPIVKTDEKGKVKVENGNLRKEIKDFDDRIKKLEKQQANFQKQVENMGAILQSNLRQILKFKKQVNSKLPSIDANNS